MRPITLSRAIAWIGVAVAGWSLSLRWGDDPRVPNGPPGQWERHVVGTALLCGLVAIICSLPAKDGVPGPIRRGLSGALALTALAIPIYLRQDASSSGATHLIAGSGWLWLAIGGGLSVAAVGTTLFVKAAKPADKSKKRRGR